MNLQYCPPANTIPFYQSAIIDSIPAGGAQSLSSEGQKAVASLKSFMDQVKLLKAERDALEGKFKAGGDVEEIRFTK